MSTTERPTLTLIDGSSYIFRAYHAIPHLSTSKGLPTNAVYGFTNMLLKALREGAPTHVGIAFDLEARTFRQTIDPNYKANRPPPPEDLLPQFSLVRDVVRALNVPVLEVRGYEADDVIATLAKQAVAEGFRVLIITGDKDFMQLVSEHVELYDSMLDKHTRLADVPERLGVRADQVVEYMSLVGDDIDNVPGVPKVGPKTAAALIQRFNTSEELIARLDEVPKTDIRGAKALAERLREHVETIRKAKQLVTLKHDLELPVVPKDLARRFMDEPAVRKLFTELEFTRLLRDLPPPPVSEARASIKTVLDEAGLDAMVARLEQAPKIALRAYGAGPHPRIDPLVGLAFAVGGGEAYYLPLGHHYLGMPRQLAKELVGKRLAAVLEDEKKPKVGHDLKADLMALRQLGIHLKGLVCDVQLASYLLNASRREHLLADLARERLGCELPGDVRAAGAKKRDGRDVTVEEAAPFVASCADAAHQLAAKLVPELEEGKLLALFADLEMPLLPILAEMELAGVKVDRAALARMEKDVSALLADQEAKVYELAGASFNINSNSQLAKVLFEDLKLPVIRKGKSGPSADQEVLEKLAEQHPLPREILEYRSLFKLKGTYLDALPTLIERDGRIHTSFHQALTATGRLSSSDPNLQNIPVRTELGKRVREAFIAEDGNLLLSADYSQIELRVLAHVSDDPALLDAFSRNEDVHTRTAAEVYGVDPQQVTPEMRRTAKAINFGIAYGLTSFGLGQRLDLPGAEAQAIINKYFERYKGVRTWLDATIAQARQTAEVATLFGRRRFVPEIHSRNPATRNGAERIAVNTPIQGTAADLIKRAMIEVDRRLRSESLQARLILQVHDELLVEAPEAEVEKAKVLMVEAMRGAGQLKVPLLVEIGVGKTWATAH
ncbi:MAG TPA: DNA polymerase I [Myxococcales bacterium]|jgi:DNA polymerase-1